MRKHLIWAAGLIAPAALLALASTAGAQTILEGPTFMGRQVTIGDPGRKSDGSPNGRATVCVQGPPEKQCYTAPDSFGNNPQVTVVQIDKQTPALFFSAETGGVSGWNLHFALLRPGRRTDLADLFFSDISVSNQSRHVFWNEPSISDSEIFVTADYVWGPSEGHYNPHRYIISAYVRLPSSMVDGLNYYLQDQYMTTRTYDMDANDDILMSEKPEILARLKRVKAEQEASKAKSPR